jgi:hypothetical protein
MGRGSARPCGRIDHAHSLRARDARRRSGPLIAEIGDTRRHQPTNRKIQNCVSMRICWSARPGSWASKLAYSEPLTAWIAEDCRPIGGCLGYLGHIELGERTGFVDKLRLSLANPWRLESRKIRARPGPVFMTWDYWSARPGSNRRSMRLRRPRPSAWECDGSRETALVFISVAEMGVFKGC